MQSRVLSLPRRTFDRRTQDWPHEEVTIVPNLTKPRVPEFVLAPFQRFRLNEKRLEETESEHCWGMV